MSELRGMPSDVLVEDYIQVRAPMVALLKSANAALVWTRVEYRARHVAFAHEHGGRTWWEVSAKDLAPEVGLGEDAVARALSKLVEGGYLLAEQHSLPMQTYSYSPVISQSAESRNGPDPIRENADSSPRIRGVQSANSQTPPINEEREEVEEAPVVPTGRSEKITAFLMETFEEAWKHWPRKESKKKALERFMKLREPLEVASVIHAHGDAHARFTPTQFVPHLATWLNQERWNDPLPQPRGEAKLSTVDHGRSVDEILREREQAERLAVTA